MSGIFNAADAPPLAADTKAFLETLYSLARQGWLEITYIAPPGRALRPNIFTEWLPLPLTLNARALQRWQHANTRGYGIYFGCAVRQARKETGRGKQEDAARVTALWCDIDGVSAKAGYQRLIGMPLQPSIIVFSGGGVHGYWLLDNPVEVNPDSAFRLRRVLHGTAIAAGEGGDAKVRDLARVMRLPGFVNTKRNAMCEVLDLIPCHYAFSDVERAFSRFAPIETPLTRTLPTALRAQTTMPRWVKQYLENGAREGERNTRAYAAARALLDSGHSASEVENLIAARARADGLGEREIKTLLQSALKAPRGAPSMATYMRARMAAADHKQKRKK